MCKFQVLREHGTTSVGRVGRFHFSAARPMPARFRLVAVLDDGRRAVIRLGQTRAEAESEPLPLNEALHGRVVELQVEQWIGRWTDGWWTQLPPRRKRRLRRI